MEDERRLERLVSAGDLAAASALMRLARRRADGVRLRMVARALIEAGHPPRVQQLLNGDPQPVAALLINLTARPVRLLEPIEAPLRWDRRLVRSFAADCAERALACHPEEAVLWRAVEAARRFADGEGSAGELTLAREAAWAAERRAEDRRAVCAARAAAWAAERPERLPWIASCAAMNARAALRGPGLEAQAPELAWQAARLLGCFLNDVRR